MDQHLKSYVPLCLLPVAELLPNDGENEIRVLLGQKGESLLRAVGEAASQPPAEAKRCGLPIARRKPLRHRLNAFAIAETDQTHHIKRTHLRRVL